MLRLLLLLFLSLGLSGCGSVPQIATSAESEGRNATVKRGSFRRTVRLTGATSAVESFTVLVPRLSGQASGMLIITGIVKNGTRVKEGDVLVEFDRQNQEKTILDRQAEYDGLVQQIRKKKADQVSARIADETAIKSAEVDLKTAFVEMRKNDLIPKHQAEINKANLAEAEAQLTQLKETFALKRQAEAADLRILEIQRDRAHQALLYAQSNVKKMTVRAPMDGLAVLVPITKGSRSVDPQEGDEVRPGGGLMLVVDPSAMQVKARINQVDVANIRVDQPAEIRLDAYPDLVFPGTVEMISAIGISGSSSRQIRYFSSTISVQGRDPRLLPDLTAAVDIIVENLDNVLIVPREAIIEHNDRTEVEILHNSRYERRQVKTGPMNDCEVVIESGLDEGMVVSTRGDSPDIAISNRE